MSRKSTLRGKYHKTNWQTHYRNKLWILPSLVNLKMHMWPLILIVNALEPNKPKGICDHYYQLNSNDIENTEIGTNVRIRIIIETQWLSIWLLVSNTKLHCVTTTLQSCQLKGSVSTADDYHCGTSHADTISGLTQSLVVTTPLNGNDMQYVWQHYSTNVITQAQISFQAWEHVALLFEWIPRCDTIPLYTRGKTRISWQILTWHTYACWNRETPWASCQIAKIVSCTCAGNAGNVSPLPRVSDPDMHHGTCVTHLPWCMPGSLTIGFLWSWLQGKRSRHSRRMREIVLSLI